MLKDVDINNIQVSSMVSYIVKGSKYIIGYIDDGDDDYRIKPLHIMLPKTRGYVKIYEGKTKLMFSFDWKWWFLRKI